MANSGRLYDGRRAPGPVVDEERIVAIRRADAHDRAALDRLADRDCQLPLAGPALLALVDGEPWAALALGSGRVVADPFRPTADTVTLLRVRAEHLQGGMPQPRRRALRGLLRLRRALL